MNKVRVISISILSLCTVALVASESARGQKPAAMLHSATQTSADNHAVGLNLVRTVLVAEVEHKEWHGAYASWNDLYNAPDEQKRWGRSEMSAGPEVVPGWKLSLVASGDGQTFKLSIKDLADKCGFSYFADESGVIYQGSLAVVGCAVPPQD